jgi:hypothetical protein
MLPPLVVELSERQQVAWRSKHDDLQRRQIVKARWHSVDEVGKCTWRQNGSVTALPEKLGSLDQGVVEEGAT